jgi:hypothetical protein
MSKSVTNVIVRNGIYDNIMKKYDQEKERKKKEFREFWRREMVPKEERG